MIVNRVVKRVRSCSKRRDNTGGVVEGGYEMGYI
jgi:hypothetical protein